MKLIQSIRWKRDENGKKVYNPETKKPILQFVSIKRLDTNEWAIPGVKFVFGIQLKRKLFNFTYIKRVCAIRVRKYLKH